MRKTIEEYKSMSKNDLYNLVTKRQYDSDEEMELMLPIVRNKLNQERVNDLVEQQKRKEKPTASDAFAAGVMKWFLFPFKIALILLALPFIFLSILLGVHLNNGRNKYIKDFKE